MTASEAFQIGQSVVAIILLPCVAWLMLTAKDNGERLARLETLLKSICPNCGRKTQYEDE